MTDPPPVAVGDSPQLQHTPRPAAVAARSQLGTVPNRDEVGVGVLALQGAFGAHQRLLESLGVRAHQVRTPDDLAGVDALVMPGGESTTMSKLLVTSGLFAPIADRLTEGMPVFGTCAGMILLATEVLDGRADQRSFGAIDISVQRNGYGRQIDSFEADLDIASIDGGPFRGVFIRAPKVVAVGGDVEVLAVHEGVPVLVRRGPVTVASFHPELADDVRLHAQFVARLRDHAPIRPTAATESP